MVTDLSGPISDFVAQYGLVAIFVCLTLDAAMLMPLLPGEVVIALATAKYADDLFSLGFLILFATVAATTGGLLLYGIARGAGRRFFEKYPRLFFMKPRTRDRMERLFQRPAGQSLVLILRLFPFLRLIVNIPAGLAKMPVKRFLVLTFIGNLLFHSAFMYVTYESRRPDSPVAATVDAWQAAYADPVVGFFQTNWLLSVAALIALGVVLSVRASIKAARNPEEGYSGSLIGSLATLTLFWGGAAVLAGLWADPRMVYDSIAVSGFDVRGVRFGVPFEPFSVVAAAGGLAVVTSVFVGDIRRTAKRRTKETKKRIKKWESLGFTVASRDPPPPAPKPAEPGPADQSDAQGDPAAEDPAERRPGEA